MPTNIDDDLWIAEQVIDTLREMDDEVEVSLSSDEDGFDLEIRGGVDQTQLKASLTKLMRDCRRADTKDEIRQRVQEYCQLLINQLAELPTYTPEQLCLVPLPNFEQMEGLGSKFRRPLAWELDGVLAWNLPDIFVFPTTHLGESEQIDPDQAFEQARSNLRGCFEHITRAGEGATRCMGVTIRDPLNAAAALAHPDLLAQASEDIALPRVLLVPDRETAVVTSMQCREHVLRAAICNLERFEQSRHPVCPFPLELQEDGRVIGPIEDMKHLAG